MASEGDDLVSPAALRSPPLYGRAPPQFRMGHSRAAWCMPSNTTLRTEAALPMVCADGGCRPRRGAPACLPVPLHRGLWHRRYNQAGAAGHAHRPPRRQALPPCPGWSAGNGVPGRARCLPAGRQCPCRVCTAAGASAAWGRSPADRRRRRPPAPPAMPVRRRCSRGCSSRGMFGVALARRDPRLHI